MFSIGVPIIGSVEKKKRAPQSKARAQGACSAQDQVQGLGETEVLGPRLVV